MQALVGIEPTAHDQVVSDTISGLVWDDGSGRLAVGRSKTDAKERTVYLTPAAVEALGGIRPADADGAALIFGLSALSISRRICAALQWL